MNAEEKQSSAVHGEFFTTPPLSLPPTILSHHTTRVPWTEVSLYNLCFYVLFKTFAQTEYSLVLFAQHVFFCLTARLEL